MPRFASIALTVFCLLTASVAVAHNEPNPPLLAKNFVAWGNGGNDVLGNLSIRVFIHEAENEVKVAWWDFVKPRWHDEDRSVRGNLIGTAVYKIERKVAADRPPIWATIQGELVSGANPFDEAGHASSLRLEVGARHWARNERSLYVFSRDAFFRLQGGEVTDHPSIDPEAFLSDAGADLSQLVDD